MAAPYPGRPLTLRQKLRRAGGGVERAAEFARERPEDDFARRRGFGLLEVAGPSPEIAAAQGDVGVDERFPFEDVDVADESRDLVIALELLPVINLLFPVEETELGPPACPYPVERPGPDFSFPAKRRQRRDDPLPSLQAKDISVLHLPVSHEYLLTIDFSAVSDLQDANDPFFIIDSVYDSIIP